jgi:hypothetical protein
MGHSDPDPMVGVLLRCLHPPKNRGSRITLTPTQTAECVLCVATVRLGYKVTRVPTLCCLHASVRERIKAGSMQRKKCKPRTSQVVLGARRSKCTRWVMLLTGE